MFLTRFFVLLPYEKPSGELFFIVHLWALILATAHLAERLYALVGVDAIITAIVVVVVVAVVAATAIGAVICGGANDDDDHSCCLLIPFMDDYHPSSNTHIATLKYIQSS